MSKGRRFALREKGNERVALLFLSYQVDFNLCQKSLEADGLEKQINTVLFSAYHTVDVHSSLEQGLDGAVVSVACSQVKRSVSASVAGHEVGVSAYQHAHHLHKETQPLVGDER